MITQTNQKLLEAIRSVNGLTNEVSKRVKATGQFISYTLAQILSYDQVNIALKNIGLQGKPVEVSSASKVELSSTPTVRVILTGNVDVADFGSAEIGVIRKIRFAGSVRIKNSSKIIATGGVDFVSEPGDLAEFESIGGGVWQMTALHRRSGVLKAWKSELAVNGALLSASTSYATSTAAEVMTMNLPSGANVGDSIELLNTSKSWSARNVTIVQNGVDTICGKNEPFIVDVDVPSLVLKCAEVSNGKHAWIVQVSEG